MAKILWKRLLNTGNIIKGKNSWCRIFWEKEILLGNKFGRMVHTEAKIKELGYELPKVTTPAANYILSTRVGNLVFTAGHISQNPDASLITGCVGKDLSVEDGYKAATRCALSLLATLREEIGDLDNLVRVVKLTGFVNCGTDFKDQPKVINGASDLLVKILGDKGKHVRSAVGSSGLPLGVSVEIEAIFEVEA